MTSDDQKLGTLLPQMTSDGSSRILVAKLVYDGMLREEFEFCDANPVNGKDLGFT